MFKRITVIAGAASVLLMAHLAHAAGKTTGETIDDSTIATKTKTGLLGDKTAPGNAINVEVYKGQILLAGFVGSDAEKAAAIAVAEKVAGMVKVIDGLVVQTTGKRSVGRTLDDKVIFEDDALTFRLDQKGVRSALIPVEALTHILGHSAGDLFDFTVSYPEDWPQPELRGRAVTFGTKMATVAEIAMPALDDDFPEGQGLHRESSAQKLVTGVVARRSTRT